MQATELEKRCVFVVLVIMLGEMPFVSPMCLFANV